MEEIKKGFGVVSHATASIPKTGVASGGIMNKNITVQGVAVLRDAIGAAVKDKTAFNAVNALVGTKEKAVALVSPGGRDPAELDGSLLEGRQEYKPQPLFE